MIKLIATDMDGTFLDSNKQFDKEFLNLFYELRKKGVKFVVASGNQYYRLFQKFLPLSEYMYFIADNGSYVVEGTKELHCEKISQESLEVIKNILKKIPHIVVIMSGRKSAYVLNDYIDYKDEVKKYYCMYTFIDSYEDIQDDILKVALFDPLLHIDELFDEIKIQLPSDVRIVTSGNEWIDIQNVHAHKGKGLQLLQQIFDIQFDECAAFGDQMNDYELLKQVKYSYAMSNAVKPIQEIAYEVIGSNDEQSVIKKMKELLFEVE